MTIPKEVLDVAAKAEYEFNHPTRKWEDAHWADRKVLTDAAEVILTAALPHLREHIAQEIEEECKGFFEEMGYEAQDAPGMEYAARIVRGEP